MREENVLKYYVLCNRLKHTIRTGWKDWHVQADRIESVAEHIYSVQQLAIAMNSEFDYDIDIQKVIVMLAIHELEETIIGDLTLFQIDADDKLAQGHNAVKKALEPLFDKEYLNALIEEFDGHETKESLFAFWCDKLECDLQAKMYSETAIVDLSDEAQADNISFKNPTVIEKLSEGKSFGQMWLEFSQGRYGYDENFMSVSKYAEENTISKLLEK